MALSFLTSSFLPDGSPRSIESLKKGKISCLIYQRVSKGELQYCIPRIDPESMPMQPVSFYRSAGNRLVEFTRCLLMHSVTLYTYAQVQKCFH